MIASGNEALPDFPLNSNARHSCLGKVRSWFLPVGAIPERPYNLCTVQPLANVLLFKMFTSTSRLVQPEASVAIASSKSGCAASHFRGLSNPEHVIFSCCASIVFLWHASLWGHLDTRFGRLFDFPWVNLQV
jgi:hypothetical protein